jgi:hypothetical protein
MPDRANSIMLKYLSLLLTLIGLAVLAGTAVAQTAPSETTANTAVVDFPHTVTFSYQAAPGQTASLSYGVEKTACLDVAGQVPVTADENDRLQWTWVMSRSGNPPPGATIWWQWTITDSDGRQQTTPRQTVTFADGRFNWQMVESGNIRLYWYQGTRVGPALLEAAVAGLATLEEEMGITLDSPVTIYIYDSSANMRQALLYVQDWAGGVAFVDYNTILMGVPAHSVDSWGKPTLRHELAHLVIGQFGRSCVGGGRPNWLEEGLAVYAEGPPSERVQQDIQAGIEQNRFEPLRSLTGPFPAHGSEATMAYSQSYSIVAYLLETYGPDKMQSLLLTLAEGTGYDAALQRVYGFTMDELEVAWRAAIGAPARAIPPTPLPLDAAPLPTLPPLAAPESVPTPALIAVAEEETAVSPTGSLCGIGLLPLLLLIFGRQINKKRSPKGPEKSKW